MRSFRNLFRVLAGVGLLSLGACEKIHEIPRQIDHLSFGLIGGTVFSAPDQVTMKEIHLDKGLLVGRDVVVEGTVVELGRFSTYMVLSDESARLLVVLTEADAERWVEREPGGKRKLKVLGTIENGRKGLPYIQAKSLTKSALPPQGKLL